jgi:hypothetical protein
MVPPTKCRRRPLKNRWSLPIVLEEKLEERQKQRTLSNPRLGMARIHRLNEKGKAMRNRVFVAAGLLALGLAASPVLAQCNCAGSVATTYAPAASSYATYYTPTVAYYEPAASYVSYYAPPAPQVTYYEPAAPQVTYYAPATPQVTYYAPAAPQVTYYTQAAPYVAYYGTAGWSVYGTPKVYMAGEPVRNVLRAVTP